MQSSSGNHPWRDGLEPKTRIHIEIRACTSKTRIRRLVPILDPLRECPGHAMFSGNWIRHNVANVMALRVPVDVHTRDDDETQDSEPKERRRSGS